ncbi:unnamed protein product [Staurois parvus]|uniref:Uncharacterized protein n=1 Tax=Staurois parvus TaxID=386267 RepID=A0ABN9C119_9NEOB|nr:unnamed protein product [Staurois parvus]
MDPLSWEPTREMSPSSVFPGFHTGRSHHPSPSSEWNPRASDEKFDVKEEYKEEDEEYGVMAGVLEGHKEMMEPPEYQETHQRQMSPVLCIPGIPTQEGHTIPQYCKRVR